MQNLFIALRFFDAPGRTFLPAVAATVALACFNVPRFHPDGGLEVANITIDIFNLAVCEKRDIRMLAQDTILGVRMHAAQSSVGKVLSNWAM